MKFAFAKADGRFVYGLLDEIKTTCKQVHVISQHDSEEEACAAYQEYQSKRPLWERLKV